MRVRVCVCVLVEDRCRRERKVVMVVGGGGREGGFKEGVQIERASEGVRASGARENHKSEGTS